ncbi:MAG TPA: phospholipase, partial [Arenibaculum sp.]|nr:phospholipase [Arenibaculum sp.]
MPAAYRRAGDAARAGARPVDEETRALDTKPSAPAGSAQPILVPGDTCWRIVRADRFAVIVDAADYFRVAKQAMASARRALLAIGWDFDLRIRLEPDREDKSRPDQLGPFVLELVRDTPGLQAYVLKWDIAMLATLTQQVFPLMALHWLTMPRLHFRLDSRHPFGACHHQKILVIDDALAFCGGIDMTHDRWDTSAHEEDDPCRVRP